MNLSETNYWPKSKVERLIEEYKKRPNLWDPSNSKYNNKKLRESDYAEIGLIICESTECIKKKINNLRSQYLSEIKKINRSKYNSEGDTDSTRTPKWWAFNLINFLKEYPLETENVEQQNNTPSSTYIIRVKKDSPPRQNTPNEIVDVNDFYVQPAQSSMIKYLEKPAPKSKKMKVNDSQPAYVSILKSSQKKEETTSNPNDTTSSVISALNSSPKDAYDSYGKYIADEIRSIPDIHQQQLLKLKIQQMIYYAHKGWLQETDEL